MEDKMHWSPDGRWIYALSDQDGFNASGHILDPQTTRGPQNAGNCYSLAAPASPIRNANLVRKIFPWRATRSCSIGAKLPAASSRRRSADRALDED